MSKLDLLKLLQSYGEEAEIADFSPDELQEMLSRMNADGELLNKPLSKEEFKKKYFEFYDDVKDSSLKKQDW
ncbi:MAG: hypothetical protein ACI4SH_08525 [Candidatus Scatosoma sp.]